MIDGSAIAKSGFRNEDEVTDKFNNWENDTDARQWLSVTMYNADTMMLFTEETERMQKRGGAE